MKKIYMAPRAKYMTLHTSHAYTVILSNVKGVKGATDNKSIPSIGFGGSNTSGIEPSVKGNIWDDSDDEY